MIEFWRAGGVESSMSVEAARACEAEGWDGQMFMDSQSLSADPYRSNELLVFHNHPYPPDSLLVNHQPLPSTADRQQLAALGLNPHQLLRSVLGEGRVLFYLGENGQVKQFRLPSVLGE
jgi:hypothetical protein